LNINLVEHKLKLFLGADRDEMDLHQKNIASFTNSFLEKKFENFIMNKELLLLMKKLLCKNYLSN
jgi:hypothetical protein